MGPRILLFAFAAGLACAQGNHAFPEHVGNIGLNRAPVVWTSPESIVRDLQSNDEAALAKAQRLLGLDESYFRDAPNEAGLQYFFLGASRK